MKAKVSVKLKGIENLIKTMETEQQNVVDDFNYYFISELKRTISSGKSPLTNTVPYQKYTNAYRKQKAKTQKASIANLQKTGGFFKNLQAFLESGKLYVGLPSSTNEKIKTYMKAHQLGEKPQPRRQWLPILTGINPTFSKRLTQTILYIYKNKLNAILKK